MTPALTFLFAVAGGAAVGNLYWAQPLFEIIAEDLGVATATAGLLVTATQIGYALGILLLVPLGDMLDRRRMVPALMVSAAALVACAVAPSFAFLAGAVFVLGLTTVSGQIWPPTWPTPPGAATSSGPSSPGSSPGSCCPAPSAGSSPESPAGGPSTPWPPSPRWS